MFIFLKLCFLQGSINYAIGVQIDKNASMCVVITYDQVFGLLTKNEPGGLCKYQWDRFSN